MNAPVPEEEMRRGTAAIDWAAAAPVVERLALYAAGVAGACFYFWTGRLVDAGAARPLGTALDAAIPFVKPAQWIYYFYEVFLFLPLFLVRDLGVLRRLIGAFVGLQLAANLVFVAFPVVMVRPLDEVDPARSFLDWAIGLNYYLDKPVNCLPSLHVANAFFIALVAWRLDRPVGKIALAVAIAIAASTMLAKHHWAVDVATGIPLGWAFYRFAFLPGVPCNARREELCLPRPLLLVIPIMYGVGVSILFALYRWGYRYPWPPPV